MRSNSVMQLYSVSGWWPLLLLGVSLVLFAILVLLHPEILAYLVAFFFFSAGCGVIDTALALRRGQRLQQKQNLFEDTW